MDDPTDAGGGQGESPTLLEQVLDFHVLPLVAQAGQSHLRHQIERIVAMGRHQLMVNLKGIWAATRDASAMNQPHPWLAEHQTHRTMRRGAHCSQFTIAMDTPLMVAAHVQGVALRQLARRGKRPRQVLKKSKPQFQDFESPFFRSIP
jgi:hypothetical protein